MKTLGIIAEYNPFHNGHLYQIEEAKKKTNADFVICIISGNFTQRGEPSIVNKWEKAKMCIKGGGDLVIEIPSIFAVSSAETFAFESVRILNELKIVDNISFGIEEEDLTDLNKIANVLFNEDYKYKEILRKNLNKYKDKPFPKIREMSICEYLNNEKYAKILEKPNNILGIEYLKSLKKLKSKMIPVGIKRKNVYYNSEKIIDEFASSTGIRKLLSERRFYDICKVVPDFSYSILAGNIENQTYCKNGIKDFEKVIFYNLRMKSREEIKEISEVTEGLENLIKLEARKEGDINTLLNEVKSKRYTMSKIKRILINSMIGVTKKDLEFYKSKEPFIRILGCSEKGKDELLGKIGQNANTAVQLKTFEIRNPKFKRMIELNNRSTDIYTLCYQNKLEAKAGLDYTNSLICI